MHKVQLKTYWKCMRARKKGKERKRETGRGRGGDLQQLCHSRSWILAQWPRPSNEKVPAKENLNQRKTISAADANEMRERETKKREREWDRTIKRKTMQSAKDFAKQKVYFQTAPSPPRIFPTLFPLFHLHSTSAPFRPFRFEVGNLSASCIRCENCNVVALKEPKQRRRSVKDFCVCPSIV